MKILNIEPRMVPETAVCSAKFLKAQEILEKKDAAAAQEVLEEIKDVFKKHEDISQELQCELLLAECKASTCELGKFKEEYAKNVVKKAEALGVQLRGAIVANAEWRIYKMLWSKDLKADDK